MPTAWRYALAGAGLLAITTVATGTVLLLRGSGSDDAAMTTFRVCDVVVRFREGDKPDDLQVSALTFGGSTGDYRSNMVMVIQRGIDGIGPEAWIDPRNGSIIRAPADRTLSTMSLIASR